jgi:hypothetical protein
VPLSHSHEPYWDLYTWGGRHGRPDLPTVCGYIGRYVVARCMKALKGTCALVSREWVRRFRGRCCRGQRASRIDYTVRLRSKKREIRASNMYDVW